MRVQRLFYCFTAGIVCAAVISFIYGGSGLGQYRAAAAHRERLQRGVDDLQRTNAELQRYLLQLQTDPELVRLLARELGYYAPGETVVHIDSSSGQGTLAMLGGDFERSFYAVGSLVIESARVRDGRFKTLPVGFSIGAALFVALAAKNASWTGRRRRRRAPP
jgi:cell division protein FtsB